MRKILVIGADGQLGFDVMRAFGQEAIGFTQQEIEITDQCSVQRAVREYKPDVVIHTAALTDSEKCEREAGLCFSVNVMGAWNVAKAAAEAGSTVVFISSDYVFDGRKDTFSEEDAPHPLNVYGVSKLAAEHLIQIANLRHYIIRSSWFFGKQVPSKGYDFPRRMLQLAQEQSQVRVVADQFGSPTYTRDLACKMKELLDRKVAYGLYHITNQGRCSWYELAKKVFEIFQVKTELVPIGTSESLSKIKRPRSSILENARLQQLNIELLRPWQEALVDYAKEIQGS